MTKLQIILGSTRPGRVGEAVAEWVYAVAQKRGDFAAELVDVAEYHLPPLDEPVPPLASDRYVNEHTKNWSAKIRQADGYIFVTPEYNHAVPGSFKNAVDYLNHEWNDKALGFVSYGSSGGTRAVENWRLVAGELRMADVREQLQLYLATDFENYKIFKPQDRHERQLMKVFDQVLGWAEALKGVRQSREQ